MRKSDHLLNALMLPTMQAVLAATVLRPQREWYLSDLASHLHVGPSSLQRTLRKLTTAGILLQRKDGNRVYYKADPACPIFGELAGILTKTIGISQPLREALAPLSTGITLAFIHGSVAQGRHGSESDVDLIVVGEVSSADLAYALKPVREQLGRQVNFTRYTSREFAARIHSGNHFLSSVMQKPKIFLIGDEHDLGEITGRKSRSPRTHQQAGAG